MDSTLQLKCPNCGAAIEFKADRQLFVCEYCNSDFTEKEINEANGREAEQTAEAAEFVEHTSLFVCENCGAEIVSDENTAATFCHYCHGTVTLKGRVSGEYQPELIIPFKINKDMAETTFRNWCKKRWFLPKSFTSKAQLEKMVGLYVPFWLVDCQVDASADYDCKKVHSYRSGDYRITNTKLYNVSRGARMEYRGIPADGSKKLEDDLMDAVEPFDYNEFLPFSMNYFSGFYADKYDVDKSGAMIRIKERMRDGTMQILSNSVRGYSSTRCTSSNMRVLSSEWHYAMLPVWFMTYMYANKKYFFAINGQTGKIAGGAPVSAGKLIVLTAVILALSILIGAIGGGFI